MGMDGLSECTHERLLLHTGHWTWLDVVTTKAMDCNGFSGASLSAEIQVISTWRHVQDRRARTCMCHGRQLQVECSSCTQSWPRVLINTTLAQEREFDISYDVALQRRFRQCMNSNLHCDICCYSAAQLVRLRLLALMQMPEHTNHANLFFERVDCLDRTS